MVNRTGPLHRQTDREYLLEMERKKKQEVKSNSFKQILDSEIAKLQGKATNG